MFFDRALQRAKQLDEEIQRTGTPIGPLHGLPISFKVRESMEFLKHLLTLPKGLFQHPRYPFLDRVHFLHQEWTREIQFRHGSNPGKPGGGPVRKDEHSTDDDGTLFSPSSDEVVLKPF